MLKLSLETTLSVMLILTTGSQKISALELNPEPSASFSCLSRGQKEKIADCFTSLEICEKTVQVQTKSDNDFWTTVELSVAGGFLAGVLLGRELRK